ncbi:unnamed protein product [Lactuca saligna]|uniref:Chlorophyll a-b binding protein, chloroplastic n=1 Tax=Lactuca saligna TaxID=75948 RepID=A0AA36EQ85_LACSI|nr:unnamed protein product [Lactuca saligna]
MNKSRFENAKLKLETTRIMIQVDGGYRWKSTSFHLIGQKSIQDFSSSYLAPFTSFLLISTCPYNFIPNSLKHTLTQTHSVTTNTTVSHLICSATMAAASTAAVLNGLGSLFLSGGKRSQTLLPAPTSGATMPAAPRRLVITAAVAPKKSWIPAVKGGGNLIDPEWLDGSLPGDYGFDPLGLGKDPAFLKWYREAELIHGRWAMAAVLGIFVGQAWSGIPWFEAGADPGAIAPFSFGSLLGTQLLLMGWVESKRWVDFFNPESQSVDWATPWSKTAENFANFTGEQGYPGGKFFDPLAFAGTLNNGVYIPDTEKLDRLKLAEIKHARLAMVAMLIFYFEAGQGKTPLGALGL